MTRCSILALRYTRRVVEIINVAQTDTRQPRRICTIHLPCRLSHVTPGKPDLLALGMAALPCCTTEDVEAEVLRVDRPVYLRQVEGSTLARGNRRWARRPVRSLVLGPPQPNDRLAVALARAAPRGRQGDQVDAGERYGYSGPV